MQSAQNFALQISTSLETNFCAVGLQEVVTKAQLFFNFEALPIFAERLSSSYQQLLV